MKKELENALEFTVEDANVIENRNKIDNQQEAEMKIKLYISAEYLSELKPEASEIFTECESGSRYYAELPANIEEDEYLQDSIIACCETLLIMMNPKYEIDDDTDLSCELLKLGKSESSFNLLINIKYPSVEDIFNDILLFKECEVEEFLYSFELIGDQRMFMPN